MIGYPILVVLLAYVLGSIPIGFLIVRWLKGVDIREAGDRYTGATNVSRVAGRGAGIATAVGDVAKGALAMLLARLLPVPEIVLVLVALAVVAGHIWPASLRFRGGAGLATALGAIIVALPVEAAILVVPYSILAATLGRTIGMGPSAGLLLVPFLLLCWWRGEPWELIALPIVVGILMGANRYGRQVMR